MTALERWCVGVLVAASSCAGSCRQDPPQIPLVLRPDTRRIQAFDMDSSLVRQAVDVFKAALPNEAAVCLGGVLEPTEHIYLRLRITSVTPARQDSADQFHVFFTTPKTGCASAIAVAHDHPHTPSEMPCQHSFNDAFVLFADRRLVLSMVFCSEGRGAVLFQDGRSGFFTYAHEATEP